MKTPINAERLNVWRAAQGGDFTDFNGEPVTLGPYYSDQWQRDPKHVLFGLARYKFAAKMLSSTSGALVGPRVAEIGAGDGFMSEIVAREIGAPVDLYDLAPLDERIMRHDITQEPLPRHYDAVYSLDVFEHIADGCVFFRNAVSSLTKHGLLVVGVPSLESQKYASEPSRKLHVNCVSGEQLRVMTRRYFRHVFMFSMNDEVVHTGFMPMAHYLFAVCAEPYPSYY